jgi:hypothetical protein
MTMAKDVKHSSGPWRYGTRDGSRIGIDSPHGRWLGLAHVYVRLAGANWDDPRGLANAALIAAAPHMEAALWAALACHGNHCNEASCPAGKAIRAALLRSRRKLASVPEPARTASAPKKSKHKPRGTP